MSIVMADFSTFDKSALRACFNAYVSGAIKIAEHLNVNTFAVCVGTAELNGAVDHVEGGWRYKILQDGTLYCHAITIFDVAIGAGIHKSLPWLQNRLNPRLKLRWVKVGKHDRIMADYDRSRLLLLAGDVESNPGPLISVAIRLFAVITGFLITGNVIKYGWNWELASVVDGWTSIVNYIMSPFVPIMDYHAGYCAADNSFRLGWKQWYDSPFTGYISHLLYRVGYAPSYQEVEHSSLFCQIVSSVWTVPTVKVPATAMYSALIIAIMSYFAILVGICYLITRKPRYIRVCNDQRPFSITDLKQEFREFAKNYKPKHVDGEHCILAYQRRECEKFAFNTLYTKFVKVRDVGGSRKRFGIFGAAKHICAPVLDNQDILREETNNHQFDGCGKRGEECPHKKTIPAAILSHVDYHCTQEQLTSIVTGPTFIINHDFNRYNSVGKYEVKDGANVVKKAEAFVTNVSGLVTMTPDGGTSYTDHPYHHWQNEGTVVSASGAFTYTMLGDFGETSVYYCHPSDGVYNVADDVCLSTSATTTMPHILGYNVTKDHSTDNYLARDPKTASSVILDGNIITECYMTMASAERNNKFYDTLRSYVCGKLKAADEELRKLELYVALVAYLADVKACDRVYMSSVIVGNPPEFTWKHYILNKFLITVSYFGGPAYRNVISWLCSRSSAKYYAPWLFRTVRIPTYEAYTKKMRVTHGSGLRVSYDTFRDDSKTINTVINKQSELSTSKDNTKHDNIIRIESVISSAETDANIDALFGVSKGRDSNAHEQSIHTPITSESDNKTTQEDTGACSFDNAETYCGLEDGGFEQLDQEGHDVSLIGSTSTKIRPSIHYLGAFTSKGPYAIITPAFRQTDKGDKYTVWNVSDYGGAKFEHAIPPHIENQFITFGFADAEIIRFVEDFVRAAEIRSQSDLKNCINWILTNSLRRPNSKPYDLKSFAPERYGLLHGLDGFIVPDTHYACRFRHMVFAVPKVPKGPTNRGKGKNVQTTGPLPK